MRTILKKRGAISVLLLLSLFVLNSCSDDSYVNVIPDNSTALVAIDATQLAKNSDIEDGGQKQINALLGINRDALNCGIDFKQKLYVFETADGNLGVVAKVASESNLNDTFEAMVKEGKCQKLTTRKGFNFTMINDSWMAGFSSDALLVMGPMLPNQQGEVRRQMIKMLEQDEEEGIKGTQMFDRLDSINSPVAIIAQASALPDKFVAPLMIGAPKDADASQILVAASVKASEGGLLEITGETFSFNKSVDQALKESLNTFRPIKGKYLQAMPSDAAAGVFMNVDGDDFIKLLHANKSFQALLTGINTAIDIDKIIRSVDGEMAIVLPKLSEGMPSMQISAQLSNSDFLNDVDYWKQSCPKGSVISNWKKDAYCLSDGSSSYYFGVSSDLQYYSGYTPDNALRSITSAVVPLNAATCQKIKGHKLCIIININALVGNRETSEMISSMLKPLLGNVETILYSVK